MRAIDAWIADPGARMPACAAPQSQQTHNGHLRGISSSIANDLIE
jgi:hypothetical protein